MRRRRGATDTAKWSSAAAAVLLAGAATFSMYRTGVPPAPGSVQPTADSLLDIPLERTVLARQEFLAAYRVADQRHARALYQEFLPRIGANGLREAIQTAFHGIGNAHMGLVGRGRTTLAEVCGFGSREDQTVCVEGAMERLGKFGPAVAAERCASLTDLASWGVPGGGAPKDARHGQVLRTVPALNGRIDQPPRTVTC